MGTSGDHDKNEQRGAMHPSHHARLQRRPIATYSRVSAPV